MTQRTIHIRIEIPKINGNAGVTITRSVSVEEVAASKLGATWGLGRYCDKAFDAALKHLRSVGVEP